MTTKVVKVGNVHRMITGKLAPYIDLDWTAYDSEALKEILKHAIRFEIEHNFHRHKDYKDKVGANIEIVPEGSLIKVKSLGDELLVVQDISL